MTFLKILLLNTEYKPPRPSSARAAKARRVELTMRRLLVKFANKNLKALTMIQTHKTADKYVKTPTSGLPPWHTHQRWHHSRWLPSSVSDFSPDLDVTDPFTRTSYHNYDGGALRELHTRRQNIAGPGRGESAKMSGDMQWPHCTIGISVAPGTFNLETKISSCVDVLGPHV